METITTTTMILGKKQTKNDNNKTFIYNEMKHTNDDDSVGTMVMVLEHVLEQWIKVVLITNNFYNKHMTAAQ